MTLLHVCTTSAVLFFLPQPENRPCMFCVLNTSPELFGFIKKMIRLQIFNLAPNKDQLCGALEIASLTYFIVWPAYFGPISGKACQMRRTRVLECNSCIALRRHCIDLAGKVWPVSLHARIVRIQDIHSGYY